ncbi:MULTISPECIES: hypothetical protein [Marinobacter]|uniref:hypothetical protein n=1 Tax=Marinobacter TaxID=2742 RepID=UPI000C551C6F|nr:MULTISPECIES: hypothetical protein [Marinobacter]MAO13081.1 hypothetical protein [Marinobacter sp.]BEH15213.1 hypothetical protein MAALD49_25810 [Marinobacter shengliensis]
MHNLIISVSAFNGMNEYGGHYFSALTTARELSKKHKVSVFVVGDFLPKTLAVNDVSVVFIRYHAGFFCVAPSGIKELVRSSGANVVVAFDMKAGVIFRLISAQQSLGFIQVKAGGPLPKTPYINNPHQVHFSKKDYDWASKRIAYGKKVISWVPNRVADTKPDELGIARLREQLAVAQDDIVLMRIGRIDKKYKPAFVGAIESARVLRKNGFSVRLIMIGAVTHQDLYEYLKSIMSEEDVLLSDACYTKNARRFLAMADLNLGVGRGFMEGCAEGNYMLAMTAESKLPVVVDEGNIQELFSENFSMRGRSTRTDSERVSDLVNLAREVSSSSGGSSLSRGWFERYFDSGRILDLYSPILDSAERNREMIDFFVFFECTLFLLKKALRKVSMDKMV